MAVLGVAWLVIAIVVLTTDVHGSASDVLVGALFGLWTILLVEYVVRLVVTRTARLPQTALGRAGNRGGAASPGLALRRHREMSLLLHEGELRLQAILRHHSLFRVLLAAAARSSSVRGWCCCSRRTPRAATSTATATPSGGRSSR